MYERALAKVVSLRLLEKRFRCKMMSNCPNSWRKSVDDDGKGWGVEVSANELEIRHHFCLAAVQLDYNKCYYMLQNPNSSGSKLLSLVLLECFLKSPNFRNCCCC